MIARSREQQELQGLFTELGKQATTKLVNYNFLSLSNCLVCCGSTCIVAEQLGETTFDIEAFFLGSNNSSKIINLRFVVNTFPIIFYL